MMSNATSKEAILDTLTRMEKGYTEPWQALQSLKEILNKELEAYNVPLNIRNAGEIASLLASEINPEDHLSKIVIQAAAEGRSPEFSDQAAEETAIIRGCAVLLSTIKDTPSNDILKSSCSTLLRYIDAMGYIPDDFIEN